eukprot:14371454-Ditylum_brightwellii.AAC.1
MAAIQQPRFCLRFPSYTMTKTRDTAILALWRDRTSTSRRSRTTPLKSTSLMSKNPKGPAT